MLIVSGTNSGDGNTSFEGLYDTLLLLLQFLGKKSKTKFEVYGLALNNTDAPAVDTSPSVAVDSDTYTVGSRLSSNPKPFDYDIEADYQFGQSGSCTINAYSIATEGGYTCAHAPLSQNLNLGFDLASGDNNPANPNKQTFNQLFLTGHAYFGI